MCTSGAATSRARDLAGLLAAISPHDVCLICTLMGCTPFRRRHSARDRSVYCHQMHEMTSPG